MSERFSRLVNQRGFLQEDAKKFVSETFGKEVDNFLRYAETESELQVLGSILKSIIGEKITDKVIILKK